MKIGLSAKFVFCGVLAFACSGEPSAGDSELEGETSSVQQALTVAVPNRIRALDFDAYNDTTSQHLGNCGSGPVDAETTSDPGSGGCNIGYTAAGEWLDYTISVGTAGKYNFVPRVASANSGKSLRLLLDGVDISGLISVPNSGWQAFANREIKNVTVSGGTHTLRVKFETNEVNLSYIDVTPGTFELPRRIEAEDYQRANESTPSSNSGNACDRRDGVDKENTGDSAGGGCNIGWTTAGEWVEYDVNVAQAGSFDIKARVGSALTGKTAQISLDGNTLATLSVPNGGWTVFADSTIENVYMGAGAHTLRVTFPQGDVNLNYLDIAVDTTGDPRTEITGACAGNPSACCPDNYTPVVLTSSNDNYSTTNTLRCVVGLGGHDVINAPSSVILAGPGNDTFQAANGDNFVVPGDGVDTVSTGTGNDTVFIFDLCELDPPGETIDTGTGYDTLVAPLPLAQLQALGLNIANVENVVVQQNSCRSECVTQPDCSGHGHCVEGASPGQVGCVCDPGHSGPDCGTAQCSAQPDIPFWRHTNVCNDEVLDADIGVCLNDAEEAIGGFQVIDPIDDAVIPHGTFGTTCSMTFIIESFAFLHDGGGFQNVFGWYPAREDINNNPIAPAPSDMHVLFGCGDEPGAIADAVFPSGLTKVGYFVASNQDQCVPTSGGVLTAAPEIIVYSQAELNTCGWNHLLAWPSKASPGDTYWGFEDLTAETAQTPDFDFEDFLLFVDNESCPTSCTATSDCAPGLICASATCQDPCDVNPTPECFPGHCTNGVKDGTETDVDCGGRCPACDPGGVCASDEDCDEGLVCGENNGQTLAGTPASDAAGRACVKKTAPSFVVDPTSPVVRVPRAPIAPATRIATAARFAAMETGSCSVPLEKSVVGIPFVKPRRASRIAAPGKRRVVDVDASLTVPTNCPATTCLTAVEMNASACARTESPIAARTIAIAHRGRYASPTHASQKRALTSILPGYLAGPRATNAACAPNVRPTAKVSVPERQTVVAASAPTPAIRARSALPSGSAWVQ